MQAAPMGEGQETCSCQQIRVMSGVAMAREQCRRISACSGKGGPHHKHCPDNPRWAERRATA